MTSAPALLLVLPFVLSALLCAIAPFVFPRAEAMRLGGACLVAGTICQLWLAARS